MDIKELAEQSAKEVASSVASELSRPEGERSPEPIKASLVSAVIGIFSWLIRKLLMK